MTDDEMSQVEAIEFLEVSIPTLIRYRRDGLIECVKRGRRWFYSFASLSNFKGESQAQTNRERYWKKSAVNQMAGNIAAGLASSNDVDPDKIAKLAVEIAIKVMGEIDRNFSS